MADKINEGANYKITLKAPSGYEGEQSGRCNHIQWAMATAVLGDPAIAQRLYDHVQAERNKGA